MTSKMGGWFRVRGMGESGMGDDEDEGGGGNGGLRLEGLGDELHKS